MTTGQDEVPLSGGRITQGVVRIGDTVRRPVTARSQAATIAARTSLDPEQVLAAAMNWALITMMTRRLTRKSPRTSQWTRKTPAAG
ncbi:hypothetical protein OG418_49945 [Streptomyces phaeochromogenes]|uniref:Uncharacterized protein n=1 Tax=Streptomyces phaeochromogenes TaxID=1923 RepID=A0ABZ1H2U9_STRPH|nr:hypothetical protein [Streptomyces phaeochromogenes]MCX5602910.1 hypothetical protein [Streptomyces phaeochromogenes]WRZ26318.1 hypothetical protein OG931_00420 [Streptomyces phaeochromogenes]WSD11861.1 hypothetical protein OHB35_00770 [Streptomyces phaeochromogenes]WSJ11319.1 hypothetical protein OG437_50705 [Streptomyces phaeochromogenes]